MTLDDVVACGIELGTLGGGGGTVRFRVLTVASRDPLVIAEVIASPAVIWEFTEASLPGEPRDARTTVFFTCETKDWLEEVWIASCW